MPADRLLGRPLDVSHFLRIAIPLAGALRRVHERGLIHKDIKPANILVDAASGGVWLTGFGVASRLPREHQAPAPPEVIAGTLAYIPMGEIDDPHHAEIIASPISARLAIA
jgi:serine/threonine protein kinase